MYVCSAKRVFQNATPIKGTLHEAFERVPRVGIEEARVGRGGMDFRLWDSSRSLGRYRSGIGYHPLLPLPSTFYREKKEPLIG